jgi:hypothetical protein
MPSLNAEVPWKGVASLRKLGPEPIVLTGKGCLAGFQQRLFLLRSRLKRTFLFLAM